MINGIEANEFLRDIVPQQLKDEIAPYGIGDNTIKLVCEFLNDARAGVARTLVIKPQELKRIIVTSCRLTKPDGTTFLMKNGQRLTDIEGDYSLDNTGGGVNLIESKDGVVVWTLLKDEGKRFPKGYKLFMKFLFSNFHNTSINKLDMVYDTYIRNYNEIYSRHIMEMVI